MRVSFAADVVADPQNWRYLDNVLGTVDDGWHEWELDDPELLEQSDWIQGTNRTFIRELFEKAAKAGAYPNPLHQKLWTVTLQSGLCMLSPKSAAAFFTKPLFVCVENQFTDGVFLEAVLSVLSTPELMSFLAHCQRSPIEIDHAGGNGELYKKIDWHISKSTELGIPFRAVVFSDSDSRFPGENGKRQEKPNEIARICSQNGIECLILCKRSIENYIPDEVLLGWANEPGNQAVRDRVEAVCSLSDSQRDHLHMKNKLPQQFETPQEEALYASIQPEMANLLKCTKFQCNLSSLLETHKKYLTAEGFRRRDGNGELDRLVSMIVEAL